MFGFLKSLFSCCDDNKTSSCCSTANGHKPSVSDKIQSCCQVPVTSQVPVTKTDLKQVTFEYFNPSATSIYLCGDFNNWSATATPLVKDSTGRFKTVLGLKAGRYQYKFLIDGKWMVDQKPTALEENSFGTKNSVIEI